MNGARLSAAEKGKQKAADADDLPPALVLESAAAARPAVDAAANRHAGGSGVPRHLLLAPPSGTGTSEIEEAPPSPPPSRLPALNAEGAAAGLAAVAGLEGRMKELQAALGSRLRVLEQLRRERESEGSKGEEEEAKRRRVGAADEPEVADAEVQMLQHKLGTMQEEVSGVTDMMLTLRLHAVEMQALEDFWKPVVPPPVPQRNNNNNGKRNAEEMQALEEFWKPVPVPQRKNSKINWEHIISLIALNSWLVPYISLWTQLPVNNLTHIVGAISVLWILRSMYSFCQRFRTSRTIISCHSFWLLVLYVLYLILRPFLFMVLLLVCLADISRDSDASTGTSS